MKSYNEHLKTLLSKTPSNQCHRASALFPIFLDANLSMKLLFLNYWKLKRNIDHLLCRLYLRSPKGETLLKKCFYVDEIKGYEVSLSSMISKRFPLGGSLEIEFSSPDNLVFPFPAVVVHYQGKHFSSFVHAAQRTFNDEEDQKTNENPKAIESGFNIYASLDRYPFLTFINGKTPLKNEKILLAAYNLDQKVIGSQINFSAAPYETTYIHLDHWKELKRHLKNQPGCLKVQLPALGVFPRLIVGNAAKKTNALSLTHSYYDLVSKNQPSDFWSAPNAKWHPASLMLVVFPRKTHQTHLYFYPIYSKAPFAIDCEIYSQKGEKLKTLVDFFISSKNSIFEKKDLADLALFKDSTPLLFKFTARGLKDQKIPSRLKVGYDVGFKSKGLPCNICTNFYPANENLLHKKKTFRWAPLFPDSLGGEVWCLNDSPLKNYDQKAEVLLTFYRPKDSKTVQKEISIAPFGAHRITLNEELNSFLEGQAGWCTFESKNPFITTYSFSMHPSKMVGGDHGF